MAATPPSKASSGAEKVRELSARALELISEHKLQPTPENYAIWYQYAMGQDRELASEIENIVKNKVPFNQQTTNYLYKRFVISDRNSNIINSAAENANKLLGEVLRAVNNFGAETKDYGEGIDGYMKKLDVEIEDPNLQGLVKEIISASADIKNQGEELNAKLQQSREEVEFLKKSLEQVTTESQKDFLTGVYNRKAYDKLLEEQIGVARSQGKELCLLMVDIDHFKSFNDRFGHLLGDEVLKIVAKALTDSVRGRDIVARYGGEEFSVVLPETPLNGALKVAETIRAAIAARELKRRDSGESYGQITVSIGVSSYRRESDDMKSLIKRADEALYKSKNKGRNRVTAEGQ